MFEWIRDRVLLYARVPHAPEPPLGAPDSVRIFRAGRNYYRLKVARWLVGQLGAVIGIMFSIGFLLWFKSMVVAAQVEREQVAAIAAANPPAPATPAPTPAPPSASPASPAGSKNGAPASRPKRTNRKLSERDFKILAQKTPGWVIPLIEVIEIGGILLFLIQLPVTFAAVRLEFDLHWYIVTDRSLRIRTGLVRLQESTMSFANLQQVEIKQGPLQRLLGLSDLRVQSAGGSDAGSEHAGGDSLHTGVFHSVDNATEIRDLIQERLRKFREAGLGDPDDHHRHHEAPVVAAGTTSVDAIAAAQELLAEARALRQSLG